MLAHDLSQFDRSFCLTTIRGPQAARSRPGLRLLNEPEVGTPLILYGQDADRRVVTSRIVRTFVDASAGGTYIETRNSLYLLRPE
jgi:hypothetical protein